MEFRILGGLRVVDGGRDLTPRRPKQRVLLALLLVHANEPVPRELLLEAAWGQRPPQTAQNALHGHISTLRKLLGPRRIVTQPPGYLVVVQPGELDAESFETMAKGARTVQDPAERSQRLNEALALWRGEPLADFRYEEFAQAEIARLEERRLMALEDRVEAELALGRDRELLADLEPLLAEQPLRERLRALLMLALYRAGRQSDALHVFSEGRQLLARELGIDPGPALTSLHLQILEHDPALQAPHEANRTRTPAILSDGSANRPIDDRGSSSLGPSDLPRGSGSVGRALPLPPRLPELPRTGLVGRVAQTARLQELFAEAAAGQPRLVLLSGEPGIGKTRLAVHAALHSRASDGAVVLYGRCHEELGVAYGVWVDALSHYVETAPEEVLREHTGRHGGELTRLVPGLRARFRDVPPARETDPGTERYLLWGAVRGLLREAGESEPVVLILDDLQWADKASMLLLKHAVLAGQGTRLLTIGAYRDSDLQRGHPLTELLADLRLEQGVERLAIEGLHQNEVAELVERAVGLGLDQAGLRLSGELFREADGNPFYTTELLRDLLETKAVYPQENGGLAVVCDMSEREPPQSVREVLVRRVERLGQDVYELLSLAAVIGAEFDLELLVAVSGREEADVLQHLERAVAASLLIESASVTGRFSFAHALINHTLYQDLGSTRRARLHGRIAEALERLLGGEPGARVGELAHHWTMTKTAGAFPKAISYARLAGELALAELAPHEAVRWFTHALELQAEVQPDHGERCDLLIGLGEAQRQVGEPAYRTTLLEASHLASELRDVDRAARAALANSRGYTSAWGEVDEGRLAAIDRALELDHPPLTARRARLLALQAQELLFEPNPHRRWALADEALTLARKSNDRRALAEVLVQALYAFWAPANLDTRLELVDELTKLAATVEDPALQFFANTMDAEVHIESQELQRAESARQRLAQIASDVAQPSLLWFAKVHLGAWALMHGELERCEQLTEEALQIGTAAGEPDATAYYGIQLGAVRTYQGRGLEVIGQLEEAVAANPHLAASRAALASTYCWLGRRASAAAIVAEAALDDFDHVPQDPATATTLAGYAEAAAQAGVITAATTLYELLEPWADRIAWNGVAVRGHGRTLLGLLAGTLRWDHDADEHFALSCEFTEANGLQVWAARAHLGWAEALSARGDLDRAQPHAARALSLSREHGYGAFTPRAAAIMETGSPASAITN